MQHYTSAIPLLIFLFLSAYVTRVWIKWFKLPETVTPKWRAITAIAALCLASFSTILLVFLFVHSAFTGGYSFYYPIESFCIMIGFLSALLGMVASLAGKGRLLPHVFVISILNLLLWIMDAMGQ
jgi:hypothetical protein